MSTWTPGQLARQLRTARQNGLLGLLQGAAQRHGLPVAYFVAIASRESNIRNEIGDGGRGIGVVQVDTRSHEIARRMKADGTWKTNPGALIEYGAKLLAENLAAAKEAFPAFTTEQHLHIAAAGYNEGEATAEEWARKGSSDAGTTGDDYGRDVLARMRAFQELGL